MTLKTIQCREHGGVFKVPVKRGRPPVKCNDSNQCSRANGAEASPPSMYKRKSVSRPEQVASKVKNRRAAVVSRETVAGVPNVKVHRTVETVPDSVPEAPRKVIRHNPSIQVAGRIKEQLEPQGWEVHGRKWFDGEDAYAEITAARGEESLVIVIKNAKAVSQEYMLWDPDKSPGQNGRPKSKLTFNPNELTDSELVQTISGRTVHWYNRISGKNESAVIGDRVQIEHTYSGTGHESMRIVKFADWSTKSFRAFHVEALMEVK